MEQQEFNFYYQYKKKWLLPAVFILILVISIIGCILFKLKFKCQLAYDISLSIFTGNLVFFLTQFILYLNKMPKIKIQTDKIVLSSTIYKLSNIKDRAEDIENFELEETFIELKNLMKSAYTILHSSEKTLKRTSGILAKRIDYHVWAYFCLIEHEIDKIEYVTFLKDNETIVKVGSVELKYNQIKDFFKEKLTILFNQITELYKDFDLFYQNEKQKLSDEIF